MMTLNRLALVLFTLTAACITGGPRKVYNNTFYHQTNITPSITEMITNTGRIMTVHNPFGDQLTIRIRCVNEVAPRTFIILAGSEVSFALEPFDEFVDEACVIENDWSTR
jgi:hypothetical protein